MVRSSNNATAIGWHALLPLETKLLGLGYLIRLQRSDPAPPSPDEQELINYGIGTTLGEIGADLARIRRAMEQQHLDAVRMTSTRTKRQRTRHDHRTK